MRLASSSLAGLHEPADLHPLLLPAAVLAATVPTLLAYHQPPSATLLNQCVAISMWGGLAMVVAPSRLPRRAWPLMLALALVALAALWSWLGAALPMSLSLQAVGMLAGAAVLVAAGVQASERGEGLAVFTALAWGLLAGGVLGSVVAGVQVFAPGLADGDFIAHTSLPGRAIGNLRQPNHLCSLLMWAMVASATLHAMGRLPRWLLWALMAMLVLAMELTASRTGAAGLLALVAWGALDKRLPRTTRLALLATPVLYVLAYAAVAWWGSFTHQVLGAGARAAAEGGLGGMATGTSSPNSRPNVWRTAWGVVMNNPLTGVGFGEFNLAWTLIPFDHRPTQFFDHTHNLPLQLAAELGLPLAGLILGLMAMALWQAFWRAAKTPGQAGLAGSAAVVLVVLVLLHSMVEYPLWYAYFLLPAALAWGLALGLSPERVDFVRLPLGGPGAALGLATCVLMAAGGALALLDYQRVVVIYAPLENSGSLASRIEQGQRSPLFAHHADYAAATNESSAQSTALAFARAPHSLMDTRLMVAWARALAEAGQVDRARWLAQRLKEFRNPEADEFFAPCASGGTQEFQCQPAQSTHAWREFLAPREGVQAVPAAAPASAASQ